METIQRIQEICDSVKDLLIRKNKDYGNSAFTAPILAPDVSVSQALCVRLSDKINRMRNLLKGAEDHVGEPLVDTVKDTIGYLVLLLAVLQEPSEENKDE